MNFESLDIDDQPDFVTEREVTAKLNRLFALIDQHENGEPTEEYEFFQSETERKELFECCKDLTEHLHEYEIPNLVIIDRSSRPVYVGVMEYWRDKYPDEKMPGIYFMNPKGFKSKEKLTEEELAMVAEDCMLKGDLLEDHQKARTEAEIIAEVQETYQRLFEDRDKPLLVFDSCIHSGDTLSPVKDVLEKAGFTKMEIGSVNPSDRHSAVRADYFITRERPEKGCYPFDRDRLIEKTFDHVYSKRAENPRAAEVSRELREEIRRIMKEFLEKEKGL